MALFVHLLIESRVDDFKKLLKGVYNDEYIQNIVDRDTSKNHKNLMWIGKVLKDNRDEIDLDELFKNLELFNKIAKTTDLYKFKEYIDFVSFLTGKSKEVASGKMAQIKKDSKTLANTKRWLVVVPQSHNASRYFGGGTSWCISTSNETHWTNHYYSNTIVMIKDRSLPSDNRLHKVALVGNKENDYSGRYDDTDEKMAHLVDVDIFDAEDTRMTRMEKRQYIQSLPNNLVDDILNYFEGDNVTERQYELWMKNADEKFTNGDGLRELMSELFDATEKVTRLTSTDIDQDEFYDKMNEKFNQQLDSDFDDFLSELWNACISEQGVDSDEFTPSIYESNLSRLVNYTSVKYNDYIDLATEVLLENKDAIAMDEIIEQSLIKYGTKDDPYDRIVRIYDSGQIPNTNYLKTLSDSLSMYNAKYNPNWFQGGQMSLKLGNTFGGIVNKFLPRNIDDVIKILNINQQAKEMVDLIQRYRKDLYESKKKMKYREFFN